MKEEQLDGSQGWMKRCLIGYGFVAVPGDGSKQDSGSRDQALARGTSRKCGTDTKITKESTV